MAKSQKRSSREAKKPKKSGVKTVSPTASAFVDSRQAPKKKPAATPEPGRS